MDEKQREIVNNPEFEALKELQDVDTAKLMQQAGIETPTPDPPADPGTPPVETGTPPATPPAPDPPGTPPAPDASEQRGELLKDIFGDRFKTVDEAKSANIPGVLDEVESLRQTKTELENKLANKPISNFADDEVALYNEFVRETGIRDYSVFSKIHTTDITNMEPMEAVITKHILETPELAGKEDHVRKFFEKKYNVDPELVSEDELSINRVGLAKEANQAKHELQAVKDKLKVPEPEYAQPPTPPELTTEEKATLNTGWTNVGQKISENLAKLKVPIKNNKDPLLDYELSESEQKEVTDFVARYGVENRMELNEANVHTLSTLVYNQLMMSKLPNIVHSVFEKARNMTEAQVHAMYENPSPAKNEDKPPVDPAGQPTDEEKVQQDIFDAEMGRY